MKLVTICVLLMLTTGLLDRQRSNQLSNSDELLCIDISQKIIDQFELEINSALDTAMQDKRLKNVFDQFSFDAQMISAKYEQADLYSLRRITDKPRNIENIARSYEYDILDEFDYSAKGNSSKQFVWAFFGGKYTFYYFESIIMRSTCLTCHGNINEIPVPVLKMIKKIYPDDEAVNYAEHDLRGMYVVKIKWPQTKDSLLTLIQ